MDYYDLVLLLIPLVLGGVTSSLAGFGAELTVALPIGSLFAVVLIGHALFVRSPVEDPAPNAQPSNAAPETSRLRPGGAD